MLHKYYFRKPFLVATLLLALGLGAAAAGLLLKEATGKMDYYALVAFGVLFWIAGTVTYMVYRKMEREYRKSVGGTPLLRYTVENRVMLKNMERQIKDLRASNHGLLLLMLLVCALFAIILPFVLEDGKSALFICLGLGIFLFGAERIITAYRVHKLRKGTAEYILTENGAVVGGDFHCWNGMGAALRSAEYTPSDHDAAGVLQIEYSGQSLAGENVQRLFLPIPASLAREMPKVLEKLEEKME